jgi:hypothetical protein
MPLSSRQHAYDFETEFFYRTVMQILKASEVPFLVGGAYALGGHTGIVRETKDIDLFVKPGDCARALEVLEAHGYQTELTDPVWLGKVFNGKSFADFIFRSGNGLAEVDDEWFTYAQKSTIFGVDVPICPVEETIWSKAFTMERERYDGADIQHLLLVCGPHLDWLRLVRRFGGHWRVLLSHLVLFGFIYPAERDRVPPPVLETLMERLRAEIHQPVNPERLCQGTLMSRQQYLVDVEQWGFQDARFSRAAGLSEEVLRDWRKRVDQENVVHLQKTKMFVDENEKVGPGVLPSSVPVA